VAEWQTGGLARRSSDGPAHQVVKSVGLTLFFSEDGYEEQIVIPKEARDLAAKEGISTENKQKVTVQIMNLTTGESYLGRLAITGNQQIYLPTEIQELVKESGRIRIQILGGWKNTCEDGGILTAVSEIYPRSAGRGLGQKPSLISKNVKGKYLHPCPPDLWRAGPLFFLSAVFLVRRLYGGLEGLPAVPLTGLLTKLSKV
jgi:hypothetical protein